MALIKEVRGFAPQIGENNFLAENATIIGEVITGKECSIWFNAVVRGDVNYIKMGDRVNVQDGAVIHGTYEKSGTTIGSDVSIGHNAIVHGCTLEDHVLVGMGAIVMDNAVVQSGAIVAAGAVVLENTIVEAGTIFAGAPARKVKDVDADTSGRLIKGIAEQYIMYSGWFKK